MDAHIRCVGQLHILYNCTTQVKISYLAWQGKEAINVMCKLQLQINIELSTGIPLESAAEPHRPYKTSRRPPCENNLASV